MPAFRAFTLIELLTVIAVIGILMALLFPVLGAAFATANQTACMANLRQIGAATALYLKDNDGWFFPLYTDDPTGRIWYYGLEPNGSPAKGEGNRTLDRTRSPLAPYLDSNSQVGICPEFPYSGPYKPKYVGDPWTYGINRYFSSQPAPAGGNVNGNGNANYGAIRRGDASRTVVFADSAQVVTFLPPSSPSNPMTEEFPYIEPGKAYVQFRHRGWPTRCSPTGTSRPCPRPTAVTTRSCRMPASDTSTPRTSFWRRWEANRKGTAAFGRRGNGNCGGRLSGCYECRMPDAECRRCSFCLFGRCRMPNPECRLFSLP